MTVAARARDEWREVLERAGYSVSSAASFEKGLELLLALRPALLVADVQLRAYNGLHLAMRASKDSPRTRSIVVGYADVVLAREAKAFGAVYLSRSDPETLRQAVELLR